VASFTASNQIGEAMKEQNKKRIEEQKRNNENDA